MHEKSFYLDIWDTHMTESAVVTWGHEEPQGGPAPITSFSVNVG